MRLDRPTVGFALVGGTVPLFAAWLMTTDPNCGLGRGRHATCYAWVVPRVTAWTALAVPGALVVVAVGAVLPARVAGRLATGPVGGLLFAPSTR